MVSGPLRRRFSPRSILYVSCFFLLGSAAVQAQMGGIDPDPGDKGSGGRCTIQGRIFFPSGRTADRRLKVTLATVGTGEFVAYTDDNGAFSFRRLANGTYTISVDAGKEYVPAREIVVIAEPTRRAGGGGIYPVQIQLQLREDMRRKAATLDAGLAAVPKDARDEYDKAIQAEQEGNIKKAVEHLQSAINLYSDFLLAYNELGVLYFRLGQLNDAEKALAEAIRIDPNAFSPRLNFGIVLFYEKQYKQANDELTRALVLTETSARAHLFRGRTFIQLSDFADAENDFVRALAIGGSPDINEAHRYLGGIYREQKKYTRAIAELERYLKAVPNSKDAEQIRQIIKELRSKTSTD